MASESDVSYMRSKVNEVRSANARLQREINSMVDSVSRATDTVLSTESSTLGTLRNGDITLTKDDKTLHYVSKVTEDIKKKVELYKNIENAYKEIRRLNAELNAQQGNEKIVRRLVMAILDNDRQAVVSDETIAVTAEKLYLSTQYFFLAHIMMDLVLTKQGKTEAAERARNMAVKMDARKSAWVYFMVALRRDDKPAQNKWFEALSARPVTGNEKELLKLLTLVSLRNNSQISQKVGGYIGIDKVGDIDKEKLASDILKEYFGAMTQKPPEFPYIKKYIAESSDLSAALEGAMNNEEVGAYVRNLAVTREEKTNGDIIGKLFDAVIESCCSPRAAEINAQIDYNQKIIEAKGVIENAVALKAQDDVQKASDLKLEDCLYEWLEEKAHYSGKRELNDFAYAHLRPSFLRAYKMYVSAYRKKYSQKISLDLGSYKAHTVLDDPREEEVKIRLFCDDRCAKEKAAIKKTKLILFAVFGALLLVGGITLNFLGDFVGRPLNTVCLCLGSVAGLVFFVLAVVAAYGNYSARLEADKKCEQDKRTLVERMKLASADLNSFREIYRSYDNRALDDSFFLLEK